MKLLIVDDDNLLLKQLKKYCIKRGHSVKTNSNGRDAVNFVEDEFFDCVIMDMKMPGLSGIELLDALSNISPNTYFLVMTGYGTIETAVNVMKHGGYDFITKPFHMSELTIRLDEIKEHAYKQNSHSAFKELEACGDSRPSLVVSTLSERELSDRFSLNRIPNLSVFNPAVIPLDGWNYIDVIGAIQRFFKEEREGVAVVHCDDSFFNCKNEYRLNNFSESLNDLSLKMGNDILLQVESSSSSIDNLETIFPSEVQDYLRAFGFCISNNVRVDLLRNLMIRENMSFNQIKRHLCINNSATLSFHLKRLKKEGVIFSSENKYSITEKGQRLAEQIDNLTGNFLSYENSQIRVFMNDN